MEKNVIGINDGITINVDVSVENIMYVKKIIFGILLHVVVKTTWSRKLKITTKKQKLF